MKADLSRATFDPLRHFRRVLLQQGRVQLDADTNEQAAILLHYLEALAADLIGPHGTPSTPDGKAASTGFKVMPGANLGDFLVGPGHYYVDGLLCENTPPAGQPPVTYRTQPDLKAVTPASKRTFLVYLDVWERHITTVEDDRIREVALGGPDTSTRAQLLWQVKLTDTLPNGDKLPTAPKPDEIDKFWPLWRERWQPAHRGSLSARALQSVEDTGPCRTPPEARYRGAENQLYRVEIHRSGFVAGGPLVEGPPAPATFVWSRDNGSVTFAVRSNAGDEVVLDDLGRDDRSSLHVGDWVELSDDDVVREGRAGELRQVRSILRDELTVTLSGATTASHDEASPSHPLLRRWDHRAGTASLGEPALADDGALVLEEGRWLVLEDGVEVMFEPASTPGAAAGSRQAYRTGDYWTVPARTATGDVEWPRTPDPVATPIPLPPQGVEHHYAPLAVVRFDDQGKIVGIPTDLRRRIIQLWAPA